MEPISRRGFLGVGLAAAAGPKLRAAKRPKRTGAAAAVLTLVAVTIGTATPAATDDTFTPVY